MNNMRNKILRGHKALVAMFKLIHRDRKEALESDQQRDLRDSRCRQIERQDAIFKHQEQLDQVKDDE